MSNKPHPDESMRAAKMSEGERMKVEALSEQQILEIDDCLLKHIKPFWRKLAMVIGLAMSEMKDLHDLNIVYIYYYNRLLKLIKENNLETQGNIDFIRWSEIRLNVRSHTM